MLCCVCLFLPFFVLSFANLHQNFWFFHNWWIFVVRYLHVDILLVVSLTENRLSVLFRLSWHNWIWTGKKFGHYYWHSSTHNTQHSTHHTFVDDWCLMRMFIDSQHTLNGLHICWLLVRMTALLLTRNFWRNFFSVTPNNHSSEAVCTLNQPNESVEQVRCKLQRKKKKFYYLKNDRRNVLKQKI